MHLMDITDAYQYAQVINNIKYLDGIELLEELEDKEFDKEFIGSKDEHVNKINVRGRDNDNKFQGSVISLIVCNETML
jgi:hypothetical protein